MQFSEQLDRENQDDGAGVPEFRLQPGGRILVVDGSPVEAVSVQAESDSASALLSAVAPWAAPLMEAALAADYRGEQNKRARFFTAWGNDVTGVYEDAAKHAAAVQHLEDACSLAWFWSLLDAAGATVGVIHGAAPQFSFYLNTRPSVQFDVPGMARHLALTPFAESGEIAH